MMKKIKIENRTIGDDESTFIIAEAGVNHNGNLKIAKKMIEAGARAGADAVKFQTFVTEDEISKYAPLAEYQKTAVKEQSQLEMVKKLELAKEDFRELYDYAGQQGITFLSTPFDMKSVDLLEELGVAAFKIGSGELTNLPLLKYIAKRGKPMIVSTGMSTLEEVGEAVNTIRKDQNDQIVLLHCTSNYPTQIEDCNLRAMCTLKDVFNVPVGYSDHTLGTWIPIVAVAMGACIIEKHFTLDRNMLGPDQKMSLEPPALKRMIRRIRLAEKALGSPEKRPAESELDTMKIARKSIVAKIEIPAGFIISKDMLTTKRPGTGIPPKYLDKIIGKRARTKIREDEVITWDQIQNLK